MNSADGSMPTRFEPTASRHLPGRNYLNNGYTVAFVALDHRPQADRDTVPVVGYIFFCDRRRCGHDRAARPDDAPRRPGPNRDVQQAVHAFTASSMVFFFLIPSIPTCLGNFLVPLMIGARDLAFPTLNLAELVRVHARRIVHALRGAGRRRRYWLDFLHALQHHVFATPT